MTRDPIPRATDRRDLPALVAEALPPTSAACFLAGETHTPIAAAVLPPRGETPALVCLVSMSRRGARTRLIVNAGEARSIVAVLDAALAEIDRGAR